VVAEKYGVFRPEGKSERAIFVIDKEGIIRYIDIHDIDEQPSNEVVRQELIKITPEEDIETRAPAVVEPVDLPQGGIVMYCTPWCPDCQKARRWFSEKNIEFMDVDITKTPGAAERVKSWADGNRTTPTFDIDDLIVVDWDEEALKEALVTKGYLE